MSQQELQIKILEDFLHYFLPEGLLNYFEPVMAENKTHIHPSNKVTIQALHLYFDEKDNRTEQTKNYRPKGFAEETVFNDFPVREKKLVLHIRRRRWITPEGKTTYIDICPDLIADGTRFSTEFATFLKKKLGYDASNCTFPG